MLQHFQFRMNTAVKKILLREILVACRQCSVFHYAINSKTAVLTRERTAGVAKNQEI